MKYITGALALWLIIYTNAYKKCEAIEEGYVHFRVENTGTFSFIGIIYTESPVAIVDSVVFNEVQPSKIGMGTLYLKRSSYQGEGEYRLVIKNQTQQINRSFGSFNKQDDYYDMYVLRITDNEIKEVNKTRTPCE